MKKEILNRSKQIGVAPSALPISLHTAALKTMLALLLTLLAAAPLQAACPAWLDQDLRRLHSTEQVNLCELAADNALLIVNTASFCGFTGQFKALEALHQQYRERGLTVIGAASNSFKQEASDEADIASICYKNFGVSFTMLAPIPVISDGTSSAQPLFAHLAEHSQAPRWNFNKYLVNAERSQIKHFGSSELPSALMIEQALPIVAN